MNKKIFILLISFASLTKGFSQTTLFDFNWRFQRGAAHEAEAPTFDDSKWGKIDLPHDWSIEDLPGTHSPFDSNAMGGVSTGFTVGGIGWYRKSFSIPVEQKNKRICIQFEGVYMNAEVWLNGEHLGNHPYGYTSFWFDVTDKIKFGGKNIIAVEVKNEGQNSRWYSGSGIYRHVWLKIMEPVHVEQWGTFVTTTDVDTTSAKVNIKTKLDNKTKNTGEFFIVAHIVNKKGHEVAISESKQMIVADSSVELSQQLVVTSPDLWSPENPSLYTLVTEVFNADKKQLLDRTENEFGSAVFRSMRKRVFF